MESFLNFAEKEIETQLLEFSGGKFEKREAKAMAKEIVKSIDWENEALMHKGMSWIAKNYLKQIGM